MRCDMICYAGLEGKDMPAWKDMLLIWAAIKYGVLKLKQTLGYGMLGIELVIESFADRVGV